MQRPVWLALVLLLSAACGRSASITAADSADAAGTTADGVAPAAQVQPVPEDLPAVIARVNGEAIERWELENAARSAEANAGGPMPADRRDEILRGLLDQLVEIRLLSQEAHARNLDPTAAEVEAQLAEIRQGFPSEEALAQAMAADRTTLDKVQQDITRRLQAGKLLDSTIAPTLSVQAADVRSFYDENLERFREEEAVRASHILIAVPPDAGGAVQQEARTKAEGVLQKIRDGADFADLARTESQDPGSAPGGGDLGFFGRGQMVPPFDTAAFGLAPGAVSPVVETQFGFHIIKQVERRAARTTPFEEVSQQIGQFLEAQQGEAKTTELVEQLKAKAAVEIYL
jgi:peptidyl-prolyl cis-trans isomerase C